MKKIFLKVLVFVLIAMFIMVAPVFAQGEVPGVPLNAGQIVSLGVIASLLFALLRFLAELATKAKIKIHPAVSQTLVFLVSVFLTYAWFPISVPEWLPPSTPQAVSGYVIEWITAVFIAASPAFVIARAFYEYLLGYVRDRLGSQMGIAGFKSAPVVKGK